ncbi:aminomethyl-transferring glycine dehydrogenase subunit GcvPA [bacterium 3DAC]|nr:aminomethyl-transferring glycine dehydrogenase subunit GcvPA [Dictyoglomota bacterium]UZN23375.1 aminomethyl-transferring glycine dehydrogenase subunit GcvPA [bacterium 3DAC]
MRYTPHRPNEIDEMLRTIGVGSIDDLFKDIPDELKEKAEGAFQALSAPMTEKELSFYMDNLADENYDLFEVVSFMGAGVYPHYVPSVVDTISSRGEFYTAYTPYQAEASQGSLHVSFEWQTYIARLTGMDVANSSMYDAASATAEAVYMAIRIHRGKRNKVIIASTLHPEIKEVLKTYLEPKGTVIEEIRYDKETGRIDVEHLKDLVDEDTLAVIVQSPNFFGVIEDEKDAVEIAHEKGALYIATVLEPLAYGLIKPAGYYGADIVVGDAIGLGNYPAFGGPGVGFLATRSKYVRQMPGRLVGETTDPEGTRGFVLTLQTREQHIRRAKATSNITSNHFLMALRATVYMALLGRTGFKKLAYVNYKIAHYAKEKLASIEGIEIPFSGPFFNEFTVKLPISAQHVFEHMAAEGIYPGVPLHRFFGPAYENYMLIATTELHSKEDIDGLASHLSEVIKNG